MENIILFVFCTVAFGIMTYVAYNARRTYLEAKKEFEKLQKEMRDEGE